MSASDIVFWSIAMGPRDRAALARWVASARAVGVNDRFHVMTDAPVADCECYDGMGLPEDNGFRMLTYLKAAISRLPGRISVYVDPWHRWYSRPGQMAGLCRRSPIHIPLEAPVAEHPEAEAIFGIPADRAAEWMRAGGVVSEPRVARPAWVMVRRSAIDDIHALALDFRGRARERGTDIGVALALAYAMQLLCADPTAHLAQARRDLWLPLSAVDLEERALLESTVVSIERSLRLLSLPSLVYLGPGSGDGRSREAKTTASGNGFRSTVNAQTT